MGRQAMDMTRKFLIFSFGYNEDSGGGIVMHKLCHVLNQLGRASSLTPMFDNYEINRRNLRPVGHVVKSALMARRHYRSYRTSPDFHTPVIRSPGRGKDLDDFVVIYPEIISGNPLNARRVVRWLLYPPGGHTGKIHYGTGELYVRYREEFGNFKLPGSTTLDDELRVVHYPLDLYRPPPEDTPRAGTAYLVRKGADKSLVHHPHDAIRIDGLSHREIAEIFQKVQTFVSYDSHTAYSFFAALSGCDSVVIPDEGVGEQAWLPDPVERYGISYGWDQLDHARDTRHLVRPRLLAEENKNLENVRRFIVHVDEFFGS
jgi:hypothetical protein